MGAVGLAGLVPLARAERAARARRLPPRRPAAGPAARGGDPRVPLRRGRSRGRRRRCATPTTWCSSTTARRGDLAAELDDVARHERVRWSGWGPTAARARPSPPASRRRSRRAPTPSIVLDSDGQHPPELIPRFLAAADGSRGRDRRSSARRRACRRSAGSRTPSRAASSASSCAGACATPRTGCACSAPTRCAIVPPPPGRYEAETRHLKAIIRSGRDDRLGPDAGDLRRRAELVPRHRGHRCA